MDTLALVSSRIFNRRTAEALRFGIIWFTACALFVQTVLTLGSAPAQAGTLSLSVICHSAGAQGPVDSHDAVAAGHLKCIACVLGQTLAPPVLAAPVSLPLVVVAVAYAQPNATLAPREAPHRAQSARGPPATA